MQEENSTFNVQELKTSDTSQTLPTLELQEIKIQETQETRETQETKKKVNVKFASSADDGSDSEIEDLPQLEEKPTKVKKVSQEPDLSKYTKVDNLSEDKLIEPKKRMEQPQVYFLVSFLSPEGIMNCNVRAFKVRGVFPTEEEAQKYAAELEKEDIYFKIYCGEIGKWLDFDPPSNKVEREVSSNPNYQSYLNAQKKQRMDTINVLAGKHIEQIDKKDKGKKERVDESKKSGAASDAMDKLRSKKLKESGEKTEENPEGGKEDKKEKEKEKETKSKTTKSNRPTINPRDRAKENTRNRMKERLAEIQNKKQLASMKDEEETHFQPTVETNNIDVKTKIVNKASKKLEDAKSELVNVDENIAAIKQLMANRKARVD